MNEVVRIKNHELQVKEYKGQRIVTFKDIDECHERPEGTARKRFNENKHRFVEGVDYFILTSKDTLMSEKRTLENDSQKYEKCTFEIPNRGMVAIAESGYMMLVKSFTDDLAWEVQRMLVNTYFKAKEMTPELKMAYGLLAAQSIIDEKNQLIAELEPKGAYYDKILRCKGLINTTVIAKDYGMSARSFNKMLHEYGIQYKQGRQWFLYAEYQGHGYTGSQTTDIESEGDSFAVIDTKWTQKGRSFLYRFLKKQGIVPTMERLDLFPGIEPSQQAAA